MCNRQLFLEKCLDLGIEHGVFIGTIRESSRTDVLMQVANTSVKLRTLSIAIVSIVLLVTHVKNFLTFTIFLLYTSKVTAPQDAHRRLALQVYLGSKTLEFSAIRR